MTQTYPMHSHAFDHKLLKVMLDKTSRSVCHFAVLMGSPTLVNWLFDTFDKRNGRAVVLGRMCGPPGIVGWQTTPGYEGQSTFPLLAKFSVRIPRVSGLLSSANGTLPHPQHP